MKFEIKEKAGLYGRFIITHLRKGKVIGVYDNIITNIGKSKVADLIGAVNGISAFGWIAVGTDATAEGASDQQLGAEVAREAASKSLVTTNVTDDTLQLQATFNFTASYGITEAGVFNAATGGDMLCRKTFDVINVQNGDSLQFTYKITVS